MLSTIRARLRQPFVWTMGKLILAAAVVGMLLSITILAMFLFSGKLNDAQNEAIEANQNAIKNNRRLDALDAERAQARSREGLTAAALRALGAIRSCARDPVCRKRNPGVVRANRAIGTAPIRDTTPSGNSGGSGSGSGGNSNGTSGSDTTPPTSTSTSPSPSRNPRRPRAPVAPPSSPGSAPVPSPSAPTPAPTPTPVPPPRSTPPPVSTPTVPPAPTVPPVVPPVTVPPVVPPVCTPVVQVNCTDVKSSKVVGPEGHAADPTSNSGRGSKDEPLCERIKAPCDESGDPIFPPGLIRLP